MMQKGDEGVEHLVESCRNTRFIERAIVLMYVNVCCSNSHG